VKDEGTGLGKLSRNVERDAICGLAEQNGNNGNCSAIQGLGPVQTGNMFNIFFSSRKLFGVSHTSCARLVRVFILFIVVALCEVGL